jgi:L-threonylcarbamoyladenylate synthase
MNIDKICEVINNKGLVITPTDTVYGIMADAMDEDAIRKVYDVKKRGYNKPLIVLMDSFEMLSHYTEELSEMERKLMDKFWPGLVTFVLKKNSKISDLITAGSDTVGVRIPDNKDLLEIIRRLKRPVVSTSANITETPVITSIEMLEAEIIEKIDYIEDGGYLDNQSSTIVKIDDNKLVILREGKITDEIRNYYEVIK